MTSRPRRSPSRLTLLALAAGVLTLAGPRPAWAHCDSLDGPVVTEARAALSSGKLEPLLKWVAAGDEAELREAFTRTRKVRALGPAARELADQAFFETLVRLHRASEGAPYTGLKPAGRSTEPAADAADRALAGGSVEALASGVAGKLEARITERFARVTALRRHADRSVEDGRRYVAAYVDYVHFLREAHQLLAGHGAHAHQPTGR